MSNEILSKILEEKKQSKELVIVSVVVALGVNFLATGIINMIGLEKNPIFLILSGIFLSIIIIVTSLLIKIKRYNCQKNIEGVIIYDTQKKEILKICGYKMSEKMHRYLSSAFLENKALEHQWNNDNLGHRNKIIKIDKVINENSKSNCQDIINELIGYCIIDKLALLLEDYFNLNKIDEEEIGILDYEKMPELLRKNRFLKLFSEDVKNRGAFIADFNDNPKSSGELCYALGKNGEIYNRFELRIPKEAKIIMENDNELIIDMKYFNIIIKWDFSSYNTVVENDFYKYYLGIVWDINKYEEFKFKIDVEVKFKTKLVFNNKKIKHYFWCDKFIKDITEMADSKVFLKQINWESNKTMLRCLNNMRNINIRKE